MKLSKVFNSSRGFTLIELMVVVVVLAILAVIGFSVFSGAQAQARDGRRRSDLNGLAKAIETAKDPATGRYRYSAADFSNDFPSIQPVDPVSTRSYCIATKTFDPNNAATLIPPTNATGNTPDANGCATGGDTAFAKATGTGSLFGAGGAGIGQSSLTSSWTLCTTLERGAAPFCISSLQR